MDIYAQPTVQMVAGYIQTAPYDPGRSRGIYSRGTTGLLIGESKYSNTGFATTPLVSDEQVSGTNSPYATQLLGRQRRLASPITPEEEKVTQVTEKTWWMQPQSRKIAKDSHLSSTAKSRFQLLAAKFSGEDISQELIARLDILNARMQAESPRLSREQVETLATNTAKLESIRSAREILAAKLAEASLR